MSRSGYNHHFMQGTLIKTLLIVPLFFSACATKKTKSANEQLSAENNSSEDALVPPTIGSENIPHTTLPKAERYGVLIRAVGLDAFAALGFLQEMEKRGFKIDYIAGTGFACWIAKNWANQNRGNFAEWQSFKFSDWKALESSLLDKVSSTHAAKRFEAYLKKISSTQRANTDAISWSCPLFLEQNNQSVLVSGRELPFSENLMKELELESLEFGPFSNNPDFKSGTFYDRPLQEWVEKLDPLWTQDPKEHRAWIIIDTHYAVLEWERLLNSSDIGVLADTLRWARTSVGKLSNPEPEQTKKFDLRRSFLLQGRAAGKAFFDHPRYQQFFAW